MYFLLFIVIVSIIVVVACIFVQKATVRMEKLEIGDEWKLHEGRPYLPQPLTPHATFFHYLIKPSLSLLEKDVLFEWPLRLFVWGYYKCLNKVLLLVRLLD